MWGCSGRTFHSVGAAGSAEEHGGRGLAHGLRWAPAARAPDGDGAQRPAPRARPTRGDSRGWFQGVVVVCVELFLKT